MAFETVRLVYELSDGGAVEVTDDTLEPMGDVFTYRQLTYRSEGCEIVFEVHDGVPGCVSVSLRAGEKPLRTKDLTDIRLDRLRDEAFAAVGMIVPDPEGGHEAAHRVVRKVLNHATSRRRLTPDLLRRIAQTYNNAPAGDRAEAIAVAFGVSNRQAWRYIAAAKEKGFIDGDD
ncbi:hypothetical protein [Mycobacterium scrofulaceum]|uniref:hypothetical protein n=1 Tax=Mycobacterium scrofulaceum TaxID=1783 RepID=UPI0012E9CBCE|nr:hypothetical protein [Mycobacterium scrofulaceum]